MSKMSAGTTIKIKTRKVSKRTGGVLPNMPVMETRKKPWSGWSIDPWSFLLLSRASGADGGNAPALFLASGQRASGEPANTELGTVA